MRWHMIYRSTSIQNELQSVVRVHDIGEPGNVYMEMGLGQLNFRDSSILAVVNDEYAREVAELLSKKLGLPLEL